MSALVLVLGIAAACLAAFAGFQAIMIMILMQHLAAKEADLKEERREVEKAKAEAQSLKDCQAALEAEMATHIELSHTDPLTGLANRRACLVAVKHELARAKRFHHDLAVLFVDLDNFKWVNDTYDHDKGDEVLVIVSEILSSVKRESDVLARYGGDEFALVLPETDVEGAVLVAERLLAGIRDNLQLSEVGVTASVGIATLKTVAGENLINSSDVAMYRAKKGGRDRYSIFMAKEGSDG